MSMQLDPTTLHADLEATRARIPVTGGALSAIDHGSGPPVVFVHGIFLSSVLWGPVIERLPSGRRHIALDLPAHGHSDALDGPSPTIGSCAEVLLEAIDHLGLADVHLVGNDTGGAICQAMVARAPERFATLTLTNCDTLGNTPPPGIAPIIELAAAGGLLPILGQMQQTPDLVRGDAGFGPNLEDPSVLTDAYVAAFVDPVMASDAKQQQLQQLVGSITDDDLAGPVDDGLRDLAVPTLIAWGDDDPLFPPTWGEQLAATIGDRARLVPVPGARFLFPFERPADLVDLVVPHWEAAEG